MPPFLVTFGLPRLLNGAVELTLPGNRPASLLLYAACRRDWVSRDELTLLYWPEKEEASARHALRQLVYRARSFEWAEGLEVSGDALRWIVDSDRAEFADALSSGDWLRLVDSYRGAFLNGVRVPDAPGFEQWLELERSQLLRDYLGAAVKAAASLEARRLYGEAVALLREARRHDALDESVVRALMRCLALDGRRRDAAEAFGQFSRQVDAEFGIAPSEATRSLAQRIDSGEPLEARPHNLPGQATPFVGRRLELAAISERLADPDCRLLSIVGIGGIGKTRLALHAAGEQIGAFEHGVIFVPLASFSEASDVIATVTSALRLEGGGSDDPQARLTGFLRDKELLLVLDNLEQVRDARRLLTDLLDASAGLTVLATSREPLELVSEWLFPLGGMDLPHGEGQPEEADSISLFLQSARRVRPDFSLHGEDRDDVAAVCRLVGGVPLAIEMAAAWVQLLSPRQIVAEVGRDLDFLGELGGGLSERHRSPRAVFETSWRRLTDEDAELLMSLAVFRASFSVEAACDTSGAPPARLLGLVRRSLIRRTPRGRFEMHELLRQYAAEKLAAAPELRAVVEARHLRHFAAFAARWRELGELPEAVERMRESLADLHLAWRRALGFQEWDQVETMVAGLADFHDLSSMFSSGLELLDEALNALATSPDGLADRLVLRGRLLAQRAGCLQRLGRYAESEADVSESLEILGSQSPVQELGLALRTRGNGAYMRADLDTARRSFEQALRLAEEIGSRRLMAGCLSSLGLVEKDSGDLAAALNRLNAARRLAEDHDQAILAQSLNNLATVHLRLGEPKQAEELLLKSVAIKRAMGDSRGLASNYTNLGNMHARAGDHERARAHHLDALQLSRQIADVSGVARAHTNLAELAVLNEDWGEATSQFQRSLAIKLRVGEQGGVVRCYAGLVEAQGRLGSPSAAVASAREGIAYALSTGREALMLSMLEPVREVLRLEGNAISERWDEAKEELGVAQFSRLIAELLAAT
ncbi:MAG: tetratricopeptide repeat protein [Trueperaceae bacterium]|nr:tetratricopeptide repeat protein [Trueperaceae bacterium]